MRICLSPGGPEVQRTEAPADEILVGTMNGLAILRRAPQGDWAIVHRAIEGRHVDALVSPLGVDTIFAGTFGDSVYASEDGGRTWEARGNGIEFTNIFSMNAVQAGEELRLYAGTEPAHLCLSTDLGRSWRELPALRSLASVHRWTFPSPPHQAHVKSMAFDPRDPNTMFLGVEVGGIFKSTDGGHSWRELGGFAGTDFEGDWDFHRVSISASSPDRLFMSSGPGVFRSLDGGQSWEQLTRRGERVGYPDVLIAHPEREGLVLMGGAVASPNIWRRIGTADCRLARSRDGGSSWQWLQGGLPEHIKGNLEAMCMNLWPGGFALFAAGIDGDVYCSQDEGDTWARIASDLPPVSKGTREDRAKLRELPLAEGYVPGSGYKPEPAGARPGGPPR